MCIKPLILDRKFLLYQSQKVLDNKMDSYPQGIIIPVNKPYRWTSADVIRKIKYTACSYFSNKKLKLGHAGTLDPLAKGVLLICIGKATKLAESLQKHDKEYVADISFGATTPSYDLEKEINKFFPTNDISREKVLNILDNFIGEQEQIAPLFSAKSVDGIRAYELARKFYKAKENNSIDIEAEKLLSKQIINIFDLELIDFGYNLNFEDSNDVEYGASSRIKVFDNSSLNLPTSRIKIACSKGTYIRAFARDLGEALGTGAYLNALTRTKSGDFNIENTLSIEEVLSFMPNK